MHEENFIAISALAKHEKPRTLFRLFRHWLSKEFYLLAQMACVIWPRFRRGAEET